MLYFGLGAGRVRRRRRSYTRRTMVNLLGRTGRMALDLLFPPRCALCGRYGSMLCEACVDSLPVADGSRCTRCWMAVGVGAEVCSHCHVAPPVFECVRAVYVMESGARQLVHQLKYEGMTALAEPMGTRLAGSFEVEGDLVVPVPLHAGRMRSRGYNQSALLGKAFGRATGLAFDAAAARRVRATKPLAKSMNRAERRAIVTGAFAGVPARVRDRRILLVDDVVTTGATLDSCARALLDAGAASVRCVTFARAD